MSEKPKFTWGDLVSVDGEQLGSICAITELEDGYVYVVELPDGSDEEISEQRLKALPNTDS